MIFLLNSGKTFEAPLNEAISRFVLVQKYVLIKIKNSWRKPVRYRSLEDKRIEKFLRLTAPKFKLRQSISKFFDMMINWNEDVMTENLEMHYISSNWENCSNFVFRNGWNRDNFLELFSQNSTSSANQVKVAHQKFYEKVSSSRIS